MTDAASDITRLLRRLHEGDERASDELFPLLYRELRRIAERAMAHQQGHTLQPTALVHEAYLKLVRGDDPTYRDRDHFLSVAAKAMRHILVDHSRSRRSQKRGADIQRSPLDQAVLMFEENALDLVALDESLTELAEMDPQLARMTELRFFGGLDTTETARVLDVSKRTVERGWNTARAWLRARLMPGTQAN